MQMLVYCFKFGSNISPLFSSRALHQRRHLRKPPVVEEAAMRMKEALFGADYNSSNGSISSNSSNFVSFHWRFEEAKCVGRLGLCMVGHTHKPINP